MLKPGSDDLRRVILDVPDICDPALDNREIGSLARGDNSGTAFSILSTCRADASRSLCSKTFLAEWERVSMANDVKQRKADDIFIRIKES